MAGQWYGVTDLSLTRPGLRAGLIDLDTEADVLGRLRIADTFWQRFTGLMGTRSLDPEEGLLLVHCASIHTFFMRFPIDVAYLDAGMRVVAAFAAVKPWRVVPGVKDGVHTLEAGAGVLEAKGVKPGHRIALRQSPCA